MVIGFSKAWYLDEVLEARHLLHDILRLGRYFRGFVLPVLSTVLQSGAQLPIHTLNTSSICGGIMYAVQDRV